MTVKVFLESTTSSWSEELATFSCEQYYEVCIKTLDKWATKNGHKITESLTEEEPNKAYLLQKLTELYYIAVELDPDTATAISMAESTLINTIEREESDR